MKLDIVIPIYNEQDNLPELSQRLGRVCDGLAGMDIRILYVNDGSQDGSLDLMLEQCRLDSRFRVIDLSRNFGHQAAIAAGVHYADGDAVVIMDGDLQDPPELIPELLDCWKQGNRVVRAQRQSRKERGLRRLGFEAFHRLFTWISDFPIPPHTGIFGLIDRQALLELKKLCEKNRFFPGLRTWVGFPQGVVTYDRPERAAGKPKQSFGRLLKYALDGIFSFSYKPLKIMTGAGVCISAAGFVLACLFIFKRLAGIETAQTGFTTLVTLILFLGGVQLIGIGLLGEYMARIYDEVKGRPLFIVKGVYGESGPMRDLAPGRDGSGGEI